jgi:predicted nucleic acid-binding protein
MTPATDALVLDASVAVKWYLPDEPDVAPALALLDAFQNAVVELIAPTHLLYEVPSALTVASRRTTPRINPADAEEALDAFFALEVPTYNSPTLLRDAYTLTGTVGIAFYDAVYLALAQRSGLPLITADRKLYDRIQKLPGVLWIRDWTPR